GAPAIDPGVWAVTGSVRAGVLVASVSGLRGYSVTTRMAESTTTSERSAISRTIPKALRPDCGGGGTGCTGGNLMPRHGGGASRTASSDSGPTASNREGTVFAGSIVDASLGCCVSRTRRGAYFNGP